MCYLGCRAGVLPALCVGLWAAVSLAAPPSGGVAPDGGGAGATAGRAAAVAPGDGGWHRAAGDGGTAKPLISVKSLSQGKASKGVKAVNGRNGAKAGGQGRASAGGSRAFTGTGKESESKHRRFAQKAKEAIDRVREHQAATLRRIDRVQLALNRGDVSGALQELGRAKESSEASKDTADELAEEEILETSDYIIRSLLSLGIAILALLLSIVLALLLRRVLSRIGGGEGPRAMSTSMRWSYRLIVTVLTLGILGLASWVAIRHVWGFQLTGRQVLEVVEHPLFAFQGRPVTFLSVVFFLITLALVVIVSRNIRGVLERKVMPRFSPDIGVQHAFAAILHYLIVAMGLLLSLEVLGVGASTVAIVAGVVGLGFGFGMQHIINNFLSGLVLFFERPIRVGDVVDVGGGRTGSTEGKVIRIQARATTLMTRDGVTVVVPNSEFVQGKVLNLTIPDNRMRTRIRVGVAYDSDLELVTRILMEVVSAGRNVMAEPPPKVRLVEFADSSVNLECLFWIDDIMGRDQIQSDLRFEVFRRFREHGISLPFPQRDTNVRFPPELVEAWLRRQGDEPDEPKR